jgi:hypothetical protein
MKIQLTTYQSMGYYWDGYLNDEVKFEMIQYLIKDAGYAFSYGTDSKRLYQIILKDGNKLYTDLGGYRKILKFGREQGVEVDVRKSRYR